MIGGAADPAMNGGRTRPVLIIAACSVALLAPLLDPLLTGRVFVFNDLSWFHLPIRYLYQQALQAGDTVLWTPSIFAGLYLHGEGQVGLFHPFHQLLYRLLPLGTAFNLELVANYPVAFAGTFWFLRRLRFSHAAALFGAMLFAFSGFNLLHHHHVNMVAIVAHMPWLLAAADVLIVDEQRRGTNARVRGDGGDPRVPSSCSDSRRPSGGTRWRSRRSACSAPARRAAGGAWCPARGAVALGVLLGGIQLLPSAETAAQSMRMGLSREFALTYSLHPANLIQLWSPYFFARGAYSEDDYMWFHEFGIYSGAILPVALIWVWIRRHALPERRALIAALTAFAAVMPGARAGALWRPRGAAHACARAAVAPRAGSLRRPHAVRARDPRGRHDRRSAGDRRGAEHARRHAPMAAVVDSGRARRRDDAGPE